MITTKRIKTKYLSIAAAIFIVGLLLGSSEIAIANGTYGGTTTGPVSLPEPGTLSLLAIGLAGAAWLGRSKRK